MDSLSGKDVARENEVVSYACHRGSSAATRRTRLISRKRRRARLGRRCASRGAIISDASNNLFGTRKKLEARVLASRGEFARLPIRPVAPVVPYVRACSEPQNKIERKKRTDANEGEVVHVYLCL